MNAPASIRTKLIATAPSLLMVCGSTLFEDVRAGTPAQIVGQQATNPGAISVASGGVSTPRVVFAGPTSLEGWTLGQTGTPNTVNEAWSFTNGALVTTTVGSIARDVQLPAVASVDFDLAWSNYLHLAVALYADSLQPLNLTSKDTPPFGGFYSLQMNGDMVDVFAVNPGVPLNPLGMVMVAGLRDKTSVHVTIRINKPGRRLCLYIDNTLIKQWEDGQNTLGSGTCLRFVNQRPNRLEISKLVVSEWDGQTNAPIKTIPGSR
jgi:hypothetical protein